MLKKIVLALLLFGFAGILVWGGVNRTQAKTAESGGGDANNLDVGYIDADGVQQRGNGNQGNVAEEECDEEGLRDANGQNEAASQGLRNGTGFQGEGAKENNSASLADVTGNSYGTSTNGQGQTQGNGSRGNGRGNEPGGGSKPLTATEIEALNLALADEYHARAVYQSVIATFGEVEPFVEIAVSEQRHIDALVNHFNKHGIPIPEDTWIGTIPTFDSLQQACQAGVAAEIASADFYEQLFSMTDDAGLTRVFTNLSNASLNSHLPQFETCQ